MKGPTWVGIGAQRSGTTWFTELLCQHPDISLSTADRKEIHYFDRFLSEPFTETHVDRYRSLFDRSGSGEFTPSYLRSIWVPPLLHSCTAEDVALLVVLRDPVERFRSALRWYLRSKPSDPKNLPRWSREKGMDAIWGGMYAQQLRIWTRSFPRDRFLVFQYERLSKDPQAGIEKAWQFLGLEPIRLSDPGPSWTTTSPTSPGDDHVSEATLRHLYSRDVAVLADEWGIDPGLWPHFS